jgi:hypothetical protein
MSANMVLKYSQFWAFRSYIADRFVWNLHEYVEANNVLEGSLQFHLSMTLVCRANHKLLVRNLLYRGTLM